MEIGIKSTDTGHIEGLGETAVRKLKAYGITDVEMLATASAHELMDYIAIPLDTARDYQKKACELLLREGLISPNFKTAEELLEERHSLPRLSTGSIEVDNLIGGGLIAKAIHEFYGMEGSGKTQLMHTAAALQTVANDKWLPGKTLYLDTERTFKPERVLEIAEARGLNWDDVKKTIIIRTFAGTTDLEVYMADQIAPGISKDIIANNVKLVVVDSIIALHRAEYVGRGQLAERQQKLARIMSKLSHVADIYKIVVVINNQVLADPATLAGDPNKPCGGHIIGHTSMYRFYIKAHGAKRSATLVKSSGDPYRQVFFSVTDKGVEDFIEDKPKKAKE